MKPLVVYDTMLFLQAAMQEPPRLHGTFQAIDAEVVWLCMSDELFDEIVDVLTRDDVRQKAPSLTAERIAQFLSKIKAVSLWFNDVPQRFSLPDHPDDDHVFNRAIVAGAEFLVTWENRLLRLADAESEPGRALRNLTPLLAVVNPIDFVAELKRRPSTFMRDGE